MERAAAQNDVGSRSSKQCGGPSKTAKQGVIRMRLVPELHRWVCPTEIGRLRALVGTKEGLLRTKIRYTKVVWLRARKAFRLKQMRGIFVISRAWHSIVTKQALLVGRTSLLEGQCRLVMMEPPNRLGCYPEHGVSPLNTCLAYR